MGRDNTPCVHCTAEKSHVAFFCLPRNELNDVPLHPDKEQVPSREGTLWATKRCTLIPVVYAFAQQDDPLEGGLSVPKNLLLGYT